MKSEPDTFSFDDLQRRPKQTEPWDGVRNYQARNYMRDRMHVGDAIFFYHSNCKQPGIAGMARVASPAYPDPSQFNPKSPYFDPTSKLEDPRWILVDVCYDRPIERFISLEELRANADALTRFALLERGNRLSVLPVKKLHWDFILKLAGA